MPLDGVVTLARELRYRDSFDNIVIRSHFSFKKPQKTHAHTHAKENGSPMSAFWWL